MKRLLFLMVVGLQTFFSSYAQENVHLKKLTDDIIAMRKAKASSDALNKAVIDWSASGSPKITLMDEIKRDPDNEYRGNGANKFKMNQVVTHVYNRQNTGMVSKGDYFNSTEKDVFYSVIEKTIKKGCTVTYTLANHIGVQEFIFLSYNPKARFSAIVNGKPANPVPGKTGLLCIKLPRVRKEEKIAFSIFNESNSNESFVILNYNSQK